MKRRTRIGLMIMLLPIAFFVIIWNYQADAKQINVNLNKQQTLMISLRGRHSQKLHNFIYKTVTPGNANFHKYLTPQQFANQYGLSNKKVTVMGHYLKKNHLRAATYPGNIVMNVSGKTKDIEKVFGVKISQDVNKHYIYQSASIVSRPKRMIRNDIQKLILTSLYSNTKNKHSNGNNGDSQNVVKTSHDSNIRDRSYKKFGRSYNTNSLYDNGNNGSGQAIGIIGQENFNSKDVQKYWEHEHLNSNINRIKKIFVNHSIGKGYGNETTMDVEQASVIAPGARIITYLGDHNQSNPTNLFAKAIGSNKVSVISSSFGSQENHFVKSEIMLENRLFEQAAAQGITVMNASGDNGPYGFPIGEKKLSATFPASSPYVTAIGGTTLPISKISYSELRDIKIKHDRIVSIPQETAWSQTANIQYFGWDYLNKTNSEYNEQAIKKLTAEFNRLIKKTKSNKTKQKLLNEFKLELAEYKEKKHLSATEMSKKYGATGGSFSKFFAIPYYQKHISGAGTYNAIKYLNLKTGKWNKNAFKTNVHIINGKKSGRNVPDISGNANPLTGYGIVLNGKYYPMVGGTSIVSPQFAAMAALINQKQGVRMGFWNPQIYRFAKNSNSPFTPLDGLNNNNLYYVGQPHKLYNQVTGLGTVDFSKLNQAFSDENK